MERPNVCSAEICLCELGRNVNDVNNPLIYCNSCGHYAVHENCVQMRNDDSSYICKVCSLAFNERNCSEISSFIDVECLSDENDDINDKINLDILKSIPKSPDSGNDSGESNTSDKTSDALKLSDINYYGDQHKKCNSDNKESISPHKNVVERDECSTPKTSKSVICDSEPIGRRRRPSYIHIFYSSESEEEGNIGKSRKRRNMKRLHDDLRSDISDDSKADHINCIAKRTRSHDTATFKH